MICRFLLFCIVLLGAAVMGARGFAADTFRDCPQCPEMIVVPPGTFTMGSPTPEQEVHLNEGPQHKVTIAHAFAVSIYTITFDQWVDCASGGGCAGYSPGSQGWGRANRPVINVSWDDAKEYVRWLNDKVRAAQKDADAPDGTGPYRLLSEAEWEYAARGGTTTLYYWGNNFVKGRANCDGCGSQWDNEQTAPVGSFPPNPFGLYDMAGNVLQWVEDCYHENYLHAPTDGSPWIMGKCDSRARVMRGGSWYNNTYYLRSSQRYSAPPEFRGLNVGFRVAKTLSEP
jgi:formylglycine-generating enzyme required for sulfatase activity